MPFDVLPMEPLDFRGPDAGKGTDGHERENAGVSCEKQAFHSRGKMAQQNPAQLSNTP